jgi:microcystin-dependent protein
MAVEYIEINQIPVTASSIIGADIFEMEHAGESQQVPASVMTAYIGFPIGGVIEWYTSTAPSNFIFAQGQAIARSTYSLLFALWGTTFGIGDGTNTFNVIDKREVYGVGIGTNATAIISTHDVFITLGQFKDDQIENHKHNVSAQLTGYVTAGGGVFTGGVAGQIKDSIDTDIPIADGVTPIHTGAVTRGKGLGCNYIIKYQ